jgi:hypothetical protein
VISRRALLTGGLAGFGSAALSGCFVTQESAKRPQSPPSPTPSGYPDASNTGVPAGTSLTLHNSGFTTSSNGQVIDSLDIRGGLFINHLNVTVTKCRISEWGIFGAWCDVDGISSTQSVTMSDCTVDGGVNPGTGVTNSNFTLLRCDVKGSENSFDVHHNVTIQDCFIHDLYNGGADPHADGIQINDGGYNINISHNTILSQGADGSGTTSAIISPQASSSPHDWVINDNVLAGGSYTLYGPQNGAATNITISNNKFWTLWFTGKSGGNGSWTDADDEATVSGNQLGAFSGGYDSVNKLILGSWSGVPV